MPNWPRWAERQAAEESDLGFFVGRIALARGGRPTFQKGFYVVLQDGVPLHGFHKHHPGEVMRLAHGRIHDKTRHDPTVKWSRVTKYRTYSQAQEERSAWRRRRVEELARRAQLAAMQPGLFDDQARSAVS